MTKFLIAVTAMFVLLVTALAAYNTLDATRTLNRSLEKTEEQIVNEAVATIEINSTGLANFADIPGIYDYFSPSFIASYSAGNLQPAYNLIAELARPLFDVEAATVSVGTVQVASSIAADVKPADLPAPPAPGKHEVLDHLGARRGSFVSCSVPLQLPGTDTVINVTMIRDRTAEMAAVQAAFTNERDNLVRRQLIIGAAGVLLSVGMALLGIRFLSRRYITGPINRLLSAARRIMEGSYEEPVTVTPESDYAPLEALLQSGQTILRKMEETRDA